MAQIIIYPKSDAFVSENFPTENYGSDINLITGLSNQVNEKHYKIYIKFDLSAIPAGAQNITATLKLYLYRKDSVGTTDTLTIKKLDKDFIEGTVVYNDIFSPVPLVIDPGTKDIVDNDLNNYISLIVNNTISSWYASPTSNFGFEISGSSTADSILGFYSRHHEDITLRPYLEVSFTISYAPIYTITAQTEQDLVPSELGTATTAIDITQKIGAVYVVTNTINKNCSIQLQCSNDNINWENVNQKITLQKNIPYTINATFPMKYVRLLLFGVNFTVLDTVNVKPFTKQ